MNKNLLEIPEDWQLSKIGNYTTKVEYGISKAMNSEGFGVPILRMNNLNGEGFIDYSDLKYVDIPEDLISKFSLEKNDILFNRVNSVKLVGKTSIVKRVIKDMVFASYLIRVKVNVKKLLPDYLNYYLNSHLGVKEINRNLRRASSQANINAKELRLMRIIVPSIEEQYSITSIFSNLDKIIKKTGILINNLQILKKGLMQRLFTEGIGHTEFKETKVGKIPKSWNVLQLKKIGRIFTGKTPSTNVDDYWRDDIPFITPADITNKHYIRKTERFVSFLGGNQSKIIPENGICTVCIGSTIGKVALAVKDSISNQQINSLICDEINDPHYICYAISNRSRYLKTYAGVAAVPIVKKSLFELFRIPVPPTIEEQKSISNILLSIDNNIEIEEKYQNRLKTIKKGLMQDLLTGKKRLSIN